MFWCIEYQDTSPVTNESEGTTAKLTDIQNTTNSNGISTDDTTTGPVTNIGEWTTDISDTTVSMLTNSEKTMHSNEITTVNTTFDDSDERTVSYPVENSYDKVTDRFTTDGKSTP